MNYFKRSLFVILGCVLIIGLSTTQALEKKKKVVNKIPISNKMLLRIQALELKNQRLSNGIQVLEHRIKIQNKKHSKIERELSGKIYSLQKKTTSLNKQVLQLRIQQFDLGNAQKILQNIVADQLSGSLNNAGTAGTAGTVPAKHSMSSDHYIQLVNPDVTIETPETVPKNKSTANAHVPSANKESQNKNVVSTHAIIVPHTKRNSFKKKSSVSSKKFVVHKNFGLPLPKTKNKAFYRALQQFTNKEYVTAANSFLDIYNMSSGVMKLNSGLYVVVSMMKIHIADSACSMLDSVQAVYPTVPLTGKESNSIKKVLKNIHQHLTC